jgi:Na+-transporting NADH:ubiquinone oxidoreductase subunit C
MQQNSVKYIVGFAAIVCILCSLLVSTTAVVLKDRQDNNKLLYKQQKVIAVSGLVAEGTTPTAEEVNALFDSRIDILVVNMETGQEDANSGIEDPVAYDQIKASKNPDLSFAAESKEASSARVKRIPNHLTVYRVKDEEGAASLYVLPVEGMGLWGTMYGFVALDKDLTTIKGLIFYKHKETPGLGAEVDNPNWKAKWPGRLAFDESGEVAIRVIKGPAGSPEEAPHKVDGLSGATLTSNGVTNLLKLWLGEHGFGPYLENLGKPSASTEGSDV